MRWLVFVACAGCTNDTAPLEKLPAPAAARWDKDLFPAPAPPRPPPPPPKGGSPSPPPDEVRAFLRGHHDCDVTIKRGRHPLQLDRAHRAELLARLDRDDAWVDGVVGCGGDPFELRIACTGDAAPLVMISDCGNVVIGDHKATWSPVMEDWLYAALATATEPR
jgi:hypothetical protein